MKPLLLFAAVAVLLGLAWIFRKKTNLTATPTDFVTLQPNPNAEDLRPVVSSEWMQQLVDSFANKPYDKYQNLHFAFANKLCDQVYRESAYWEQKQTHAEFLNRLNNTQKMYFALINFEGQTNNGGVYQFLFNQPENSLVVLEAMKKAGLDQLAGDYEKVLEQFLGKFESIDALRLQFQNQNADWNKRWQAFVDGYTEIPQAEVIESYFYSKNYSQEFHDKMARFVIENRDGLMKPE
jgi:hypothetical protein